MIEQKPITVGGEEMVIQSLTATRALHLAATLTKIVGGAGKGFKDMPRNQKELTEALESGIISIGGMIEGVLEHIDPDLATTLIKRVVKESVVQPQFEGTGAAQRFDDWFESRFSRRLDELLTLLSEIFVHNYGDPVVWVGKLAARAADLGLIQPSAPSSPETPEGQPTAS